MRRLKSVFRRGELSFLLAAAIASGGSRAIAAQEGGKASVCSVLEPGKGCESRASLSLGESSLFLKVEAEADSLALEAGGEGESFAFGPGRPQGLVRFLESPFGLSARLNPGAFPVGLDRGLSSSTRVFGLGPQALRAFFLGQEAGGGEWLAGGLCLEAIEAGGEFAFAAALDGRFEAERKAWTFGFPPANPGMALHCAIARQRKAADGRASLALGASRDPFDGPGFALRLEAGSWSFPLRVDCALACASSRYVCLSGSHPESTALLEAEAKLKLRAGASASAAFKAALAREERRRQGGLPFVSRELELRLDLPRQASEWRFARPGLSLGLDGEGSAFEGLSLVLGGASGGYAWRLSQSCRRMRPGEPDSTSCPAELAFGVAPQRKGGEAIDALCEMTLGFDAMRPAAPSLDLRLGCGLALGRRARLALNLGLDDLALSVPVRDPEPRNVSLGLRFESGEVILPGPPARPPSPY